MRAEVLRSSGSYASVKLRSDLRDVHPDRRVRSVERSSCTCNACDACDVCDVCDVCNVCDMHNVCSVCMRYVCRSDEHSS